MKPSGQTEPRQNKPYLNGLLAGSIVMTVSHVAFSHVALAASEKSEGSGGLPQLDFSTWPTQIFWLGVSFLLAYLLMWRLVVPRIGSVLEERHNRIEDDLRRARQASDDAEQARMAFEAMLASARNDASETTRKATESIRKKMDRKMETANANMAKKMASAEADIATARQAALKDVSDIAASSAIDVVSQLTGLKVNKTDAKKQVKQAEKAIA
jgi:F-type H+-transporting ATPase subunit b